MSRRLGIGISTWKRPDDLRNCLTLLYNQIDPSTGLQYPFDIFIVDNCSKDETEEVIQSFGLIKGVEYCIMPHSDFSAIHTINLALRELSNEFVIILDDDTWLDDPLILHKLVETADIDPNIAIVACNVRNCQGAISFILKTPQFDATDYHHVSKEPVFDIDDFSGACALFRREFVGPTYYDNSFKLYWNEPELALRMIAQGHRVVINQRAIVIHGSDVGRESCKSFYYGSRNTFRLMTKILGKKQCLVLSSVLIPMHLRRYLSMNKEKNFWKYLPKVIYSHVQGLYRCVFAKRIIFKDYNDYRRVQNTYLKYYLKEILLALDR